MELGDYQERVAGTDQHISDDPDDQERNTLMHLLGLEGEAGSVATVYKKHMRDGTAYEGWKFEMSSAPVGPRQNRWPPSWRAAPRSAIEPRSGRCVRLHR